MLLFLLSQTALFCQHKIFTGLRCKNLCSQIPFQFIAQEAFIYFIRYVVVQQLMKARRVVEVEVSVDFLPPPVIVIINPFQKRIRFTKSHIACEAFGQYPGIVAVLQGKRSFLDYRKAQSLVVVLAG